MKTTLSSLILFALLFTQSLWAKNVGRVTKLRGQVFRTNVDSEVVRKPLSLGEWIEEGDIIESEKKSFVKILMKDDTIFSIGPASKFAFEQFKMKTKNERTAIYNLITGKLRSVFTKKAPRKTLTIKTPSAAMGVRGTEIVSDVYRVKGQVRTDIALLHGKLEVTTKNGKKFDLRPSDIFEAVDSKTRDIKNAAKVLKGRSTASQNLIATKRKLKKKIFKKLIKKPRKGGEVFLFDALKDERKEISKEAEFHSLTDENQVRLKLGKKETDRLSIFGDENDKRRKEDRSGLKGNEKVKSEKGESKGKDREQAKETKQLNKKDLKRSAREDFDFKPEVLLEKSVGQKSKEGRRKEFFDPSQKRGPASENGPGNFKSKDFRAPKIEINTTKQRRPESERPRFERKAPRDRIRRDANDPNLKQQMRRQIQDNIKRQIVNERLQQATGTRLPSSTDTLNREMLERQRLLELERQRLLELERQRLLEYEKQKLLEQQKLDGTIDSLK